MTFDDALYVVLGRRLDEPLATTDARLAHAVQLGVAIVAPESSDDGGAVRREV